jgi:plastocyanin
MLRLARNAVPVAFLLVLAAQSSALAATTHDVSIVNFAFSPSTLTVSQGDSVKWTNTTANTTHTTTSDSTNPDATKGLSLWDQILNAGQTFTFSFTAAGAYTYHCAIHTFMTASISIAPIAKPSSGAAGTTFKIVVATVGAVAPFVYDIQRKVGGGAFKDWKIGITNRSVKFVSTKANTFQFQARVRNTSTGGVSLYSPPVTVTVT